MLEEAQDALLARSTTCSTRRWQEQARSKGLAVAACGARDRLRV
jgi:hypothetical protein